MSSPQFEGFLARLYADRAFLAHFLRAPGEATQEAGLTPRERQAAAAIDRAGLLMAVHSYERKRAGRSLPSRRDSFLIRAARVALRAVALAVRRVGGWA